MIDEPLVVPVSPGAALVRLAQVSGALQRRPRLAAGLPPGSRAGLKQASGSLLGALAAGDGEAVQSSLQLTQQCLMRVYESMCAAQQWSAGQASSYFQEAGFPDPQLKSVQPVQVATVLPTFTRHLGRVLTTLSFREAPRATAYWLRELRTLQGECVVDHLIESSSPMFRRLRLPEGPHLFQIETRNASEFAVSEEFAIQVPSASA